MYWHAFYFAIWATMTSYLLITASGLLPGLFDQAYDEPRNWVKLVAFLLLANVPVICHQQGYLE